MSLIHASLLEVQVFNGNAYFFSSVASLNNNDVFQLTITAPTPLPPTIGLALELDPTGQLQVDVFRGATINVVPGGVILGLNNQNGASTKTANTIVRRNPTIDATGLQIIFKLLSDGQKNAAKIGSDTDVIILEAENETTLVRLTSGAANNTINFTLQVIEEQ